ncbi:MAG TPA: prepilin-type N-terminal cleavage/methylation domain-containing protein [Thermoanaerobaculia bacterium]|nr:prepilin-type N-terminal cleavage/methylation domain-containing protein [Thermoanaerobaculia bacterium]
MRQRGFSLAELLMALLILSIVITTSMAAFLERNRRLQQAREIIAAYQALANESEYWRRINYNSLETNLTFRSDTSILSALGAHNTVVAVQQTQPHVKNVTLTIRWMNGARQARLAIVRVDTGGSSLW